MKPSELEVKLAILFTYAIVVAVIAAIIFLAHWCEKRRMGRRERERRVKEHAWNVANEQQRIAREQEAAEQAIREQQMRAEYAQRQKQEREEVRRAAILFEAQQEAERAAKEAELLPRINDAFRILQETSNFTLLQNCLTTGESYLPRTTLEKLFNEHRAVIINAAVIMAGTTDATAMKTAVLQLLSKLQCSNDQPLLMLDIERELLSQSSQTAFEKRLQTMCKAKEDRIRIINESPISDLDKERLIEETEFSFNEMLVTFMAQNSFHSN